LWDEDEDYLVNHGETENDAEQHRRDAENAVKALLNQWKNSMIATCLQVIHRIAANQDIQGNPLPQ
jgi:hypothetical protein